MHLLAILKRPNLKSKKRLIQSSWRTKLCWNFTLKVVWRLQHRPPVITPSSLECWKNLVDWRFAAHKVIKVVPSRRFHILIFNFFATSMHLPTHMVLEYSTGPAKSVMTAPSIPHHQLWMGIPKNLDHSALSDENVANGKDEQNFYSKTSTTSEIIRCPQPSWGGAHYEPRTGGESQMDIHVRTWKDSTA